jgi:hypothetical protein
MATQLIELDEVLGIIDTGTVGRYVKDLLARAEGKSFGMSCLFLRDREMLKDHGVMMPEVMFPDEEEKESKE